MKSGAVFSAERTEKDSKLGLQPLDMAQFLDGLANATSLLLDTDVTASSLEQCYAVTDEKQAIRAYTLLYAALRPLVKRMTLRASQEGECIRISLCGESKTDFHPEGMPSLFAQSALPYPLLARASRLADIVPSLTETEDGLCATLTFTRFRAERFVVCAQNDLERVCSDMYMAMWELLRA